MASPIHLLVTKPAGPRTFKVVAGIADPNLVSLQSTNGDYIALNGNLQGACARTYTAPASDVIITNATSLRSKADAT